MALEKQIAFRYLYILCAPNGRRGVALRFISIVCPYGKESAALRFISIVPIMEKRSGS